MPKSNKRTRLGAKIGARKIDCDSYEPQSGEFSDCVIVRHEFPDGWKLVEDLTAYDIHLMSTLTKTCLSDDSCLHARYVQPDKEAAKEELVLKAKAFADTFDTPFYRAIFDRGTYRGTFATFEAFLKNKEEETLKNYQSRGYGGTNLSCYRFMHVEDNKGRLHAAVLLAAVEVIEMKNRGGFYPYLATRDLGQEQPVTIDGEPFHVLECRLGTGKTAPACALEHVIQWYAETTGQWDQEKFEAVQPNHYYEVQKLKLPDKALKPTKKERAKTK